MKILHFIESLGRGGAEQLLLMQSPELTRQGCDSVVLVRGGDMDLEPELVRAGVEVLVFPKRFRWNIVQASLDLSRIVNEHKIDVVHAHLYFPSVITSLSSWLKMHRARCCVTFHNLAYAGANKDGIKLQLKKWLALILHRYGMDRVYAVSQAVADHYEQALKLKNITVQNNPVDLNAVNQSLDNLATNNDVNRLHMVVPGRLVGEKGHEDFLIALSEIRDRLPPFRVDFIGDGPLRKTISVLISKLSLQEEVFLAGSKNQRELLSQVASSDLVIIPSRFEGFGLTALEAMALGRPVIATKAGGLPEVVGDAGILIDVASPKQLGQQILKLSHDQNLRRSLGQNAAIRASKSFSLERLTADLIADYEQLLTKG